MSLVNKFALNFNAPALLPDGSIVNSFNFLKFIKNKISVLFFWPMDFTYVCPTELIALNNRYKEFEIRDIKIIGISVDSVYSHKIWQNMSFKEGGIGKMKFPMVSDYNKNIQEYYNIVHKELDVSLRATFIIDQNNIIKHESINDLPLGRNINEIIRIIDSLIFYQKYGEVCPAQWQKGKNTINPSLIGIKQYLNLNIKDLD